MGGPISGNFTGSLDLKLFVTFSPEEGHFLGKFDWPLGCTVVSMGTTVVINISPAGWLFLWLKKSE